jgi:FMN phosphatase YigB (HAD superfamily)
MKAMVVEAVLLDVGGTLWPDRWTQGPTERAEKAARLRDLETGLDTGLATRMVEEIEEACEAVADGGPQTTTETIAGIVSRHGLDGRGLDPVAVCRALSLPFLGRLPLLNGAAALVRTLGADGLALTVVSNTVFRDANCYWRDFADVGLDGFLSGVVTSLDVGWRKPHPAIFTAALAVTGVSPTRAAIVGNSESCDIVPGLELGMTAVRVAIEEPPPVFSSADAVAISLEDVPAILRAS